MARLAFLLVVLTDAVLAQTAATYEVTFDATWSAATHPADFPTSPHFSPLVGATHEAGVRLWALGLVASDAIEAMAERGHTPPLLAEVDARRTDGTSISGILGDGIASSPGATSVTVVVTRDRPLVTLVSMLAPSPDWFVGVDGLDLRDGDAWVGGCQVDLLVYDAGTDDGATYTAPDVDTRPRQPIARIEGPPFAGASGPRPVGTLSFTRLATPATPFPEPWLVGPVAPTPTAGTAHVEVHVAGPRRVQVLVYDLLGRRVAQVGIGLPAGAHRLPIPTHALSPGVYVVRIASEARIEDRRLVVAR